MNTSYKGKMHSINRIMISVITPTYNRLQYLKKLYMSLCRQTDFWFQWIVIDDGSQDGTEEWFEELIDRHKMFEIKYKKVRNGGKHRALNTAHNMIDGSLVVIVDSDDQLTKDAISTIKSYWVKYKHVKPVMMIFQRGKLQFENNPFDSRFPGKDRITTLVELTNKGFVGDHCEVVTSEEFKKYLFPEFKGEKFLGEAWLWQHIGFDGKTIFINKVIYLCEYISGGLTDSGRKMRNLNPKGGQEHARVFLNKNYKFTVRYKNAILYTYYGIILRKGLFTIMQESKCPVIIFISLFPALFFILKWKNK